MICPKCENEIKVVSSDECTNHYEPSDPKLNHIRDGFSIPFCCDLCGSLKFNYSAARDVVFLYQYPAPKYVGKIELIDDTNFIGGALKEHIRPSMGVVLSCGKGYFDTQKQRYIEITPLKMGDVVYFNKKVPWRIELKNEAKEKHFVTLCGFSDIYGTV